ncbi:PDDEXK family nuclease [Photobacterium leiognathi]|uniref:hypothetical protein n=1 Tax=Photobacterium leiognathi TaxID=553611 RepID=UPI002981B0F0|nr:hypothetical protein [Photobacterium leiognathi]
MASLRLNEEQVNKLLERQQEMKSRGVKTGSGRDFNLSSLNGRDCSTAVKRIKQAKQKAGMGAGGHTGNDPKDKPSPRYLAVLKQGINTGNLPSWLVEYINEDDELATAICIKDYKPDSPHVAALAKLALDPTRMTGRKKTEKHEARKANYEHYIQVRIFYLLERFYPNEYKLVKAVPNGGLRHDSVGWEMLAEGQKSGSPDIDIEIAKGRYFGMKLEVKTETNKATSIQLEKIELFNSAGFYAVVRNGFDDCWNTIMNYFGLPDFDYTTELAA